MAKKLGRPKLDIDPKLVRKLATIQCTYDEMAAICGCSTDTLVNHFSDLINECREQGKMSLRRKQFEMAVKKGNVGMLVWLGKQHLGQSDKVEQKIDTRNEQTFKIGFADQDQLSAPEKDITPAADLGSEQKV